MDKITKYKEAIKETLSYLLRAGSGTKIKHVQVFDEEKLRYAVVITGKTDEERIHELVAEIDIIDEFVVIQYNNTDVDLEEGLVKYGVDSKDIKFGETVDS